MLGASRDKNIDENKEKRDESNQIGERVKIEVKHVSTNASHASARSFSADVLVIDMTSRRDNFKPAVRPAAALAL